MASITTTLLNAQPVAKTTGYSNHTKIQLQTSTSVAFQANITATTAPASSTYNPALNIQYIALAQDVNAVTAWNDYSGDIYSFSCNLKDLQASSTEIFSSVQQEVNNTYLYVRVSIAEPLLEAVTLTLYLNQVLAESNPTTSITLSNTSTSITFPLSLINLNQSIDSNVYGKFIISVKSNSNVIQTINVDYVLKFASGSFTYITLYVDYTYSASPTQLIVISDALSVSGDDFVIPITNTLSSGTYTATLTVFHAI
jgi:hypothetical protein